MPCRPLTRVPHQSQVLDQSGFIAFSGSLHVVRCFGVAAQAKFALMQFFCGVVCQTAGEQIWLTQSPQQAAVVAVFGLHCTCQSAMCHCTLCHRFGLIANWVKFLVVSLRANPRHELCDHNFCSGDVSCVGPAKAGVQVHSLPAGDPQDPRGLVPARHSSSSCPHLPARAPLAQAPPSSSSPH